MLANLVCSLIMHKRVTTTLAKAKAARSVAEKMVTLGKSGTMQSRRLAVARLHRGTRAMTKEERQKWRQNEDVLRFFEEIAPAFKERNGGYTRIVKMGQRQGEPPQSAILEWVDYTPPAPAAEEAAPGAEAKTPNRPRKQPPKKTKAKA